MICVYGCGLEAKYRLKNGKWCCQPHYLKCPQKRMERCGNKNPFFGKEHTLENLERIKRIGSENGNYGKKCSEEIKDKIRKSLKGKFEKEKNPFFGKLHTIQTKLKIKKKLLKNFLNHIEERYPHFLKIEDIKIDEENSKLLVRCKNHLCKNSKELAGWFKPNKTQIYERLRNLDRDGNYFYCSDKCKNSCPLFRKRGIIKNKEKNYTSEEYNAFRKYVLERDNSICQFCGSNATDVHHERPQKLEPFFSLDPDYAWSCCEKCHYEKGHKDNCSTSQLANKSC